MEIKENIQVLTCPTETCLTEFGLMKEQRDIEEFYFRDGRLWQREEKTEVDAVIRIQAKPVSSNFLVKLGERVLDGDLFDDLF